MSRKDFINLQAMVRHRLAVSLASMTLMLVTADVTRAETWVGGGADGNWSTAANWDTGAVPSSPAALIFVGDLQKTSFNDLTGFTASSIFINSPDFVLQGNTVNLGGAINASAGGGTQTINLGVNLINGQRNFNTGGNPNTIVVNGQITSDNGLRYVNKLGGGTLKLNNVNNSQGSNSFRLKIQAGAVEISDFNALGRADRATEIGTGGNGTLRYIGESTATDRQFIVGITGETGNATFAVNNSNNNATLLRYTNPVFNQAFTDTATSRNITIQGPGGNQGQIDGVIQDNDADSSINLIKSGNSIWTLAGVNTYTGTTTINGGTLVVNGATAAGNVTVAANARLAGSGQLGGATTVNGFIAPGNSIGTLTVNNDLIWNGSAANAWEFELGSGNTSDLLSLGGRFLKGSGSEFLFDFLNSDQIGTFTLVDWDGETTFGAADFSYVNLGGGNTGTFSIVGNHLNFSVVASVPEPATIVTLLMLTTLYAVRVRRKIGKWCHSWVAAIFLLPRLRAW